MAIKVLDQFAVRFTHQMHNPIGSVHPIKSRNFVLAEKISKCLNNPKFLNYIKNQYDQLRMGQLAISTLSKPIVITLNEANLLIVEEIRFIGFPELRSIVQGMINQLNDLD